MLATPCDATVIVRTVETSQQLLAPVKAWKGEYNPSPDEIRQVCLEIQAAWSIEEFGRRSRGILPSGWGKGSSARPSKTIGGDA